MSAQFADIFRVRRTIIANNKALFGIFICAMYCLFGVEIHCVGRVRHMCTERFKSTVMNCGTEMSDCSCGAYNIYIMRSPWSSVSLSICLVPLVVCQSIRLSGPHGRLSVHPSVWSPWSSVSLSLSLFPRGHLSVYPSVWFCWLSVSPSVCLVPVVVCQSIHLSGPCGCLPVYPSVWSRWLPVSPSICLIPMVICQSIPLSGPPWSSVSLSVGLVPMVICQSICLSGLTGRLSVYPSVWSLWPSVSLSVCLVSLVICQSICLSGPRGRLSVYPSVCMFGVPASYKHACMSSSLGDIMKVTNSLLLPLPPPQNSTNI